MGGPEVVAAGTFEVVVLLREKVLNRDVGLIAEAASTVGVSSIEALRLVVGTVVVFHVHRKNSPRTELYGLQILPCYVCQSDRHLAGEESPTTSLRSFVRYHRSKLIMRSIGASESLIL